MKFSLTAGLVWVWLAWVSLGAEMGSDSIGQWPRLTNVMRPWTYWWWPGSAVDKTNISRLLRIYSEAGLGGVHIIPIYGVRGWEDRYIRYLSPEWLEMLDFTVREAGKLGMGVDITLGTGWCFGGPRVTDEEANALLVVWSNSLSAGSNTFRIPEKIKPLAVVAVSDSGQVVDLKDKVDSVGNLSWSAPNGHWTVYVLSQRPSGQRVKRAAPGGEGHMLNLIYPKAIENFLKWFDEAFLQYTGAKPRAVYHDSYEYRSDWSPVLLEEFAEKYGYRLEGQLPAFLSDEDTDLVRRVKCDYRELVSELIYRSLEKWVNWAHANGFITRNEAHGSPGNILDFYALADIPETEFFRSDRDIIVAKLASSAAHVKGRNLVSSESGTWLAEHFHETLHALKELMDDFFLAGINHVFYHGTCYSPLEAPWPGWLFYASTQMNPQNSIWEHVRVLNDYITRCQSILQSGVPDNEILLYWPIYDLWSVPKGRIQQLTIHAADEWMSSSSCGRLARALWQNGYAFDFVSDRLLRELQPGDTPGAVKAPSGLEYKVIVVPEVTYMPLGTLEKLFSLARAGANVVFQSRLPSDVPGLWDLNRRRMMFHGITNSVRFVAEEEFPCLSAKTGKGRLFVGDPILILEALGVRRELLVPELGLECIRRRIGGGSVYFVVNHTVKAIDGWVPFAVPGPNAVILDPLSGKYGMAASRSSLDGKLEVYLQLSPGGSVVVWPIAHSDARMPRWKYYREGGNVIPVEGQWQIEFVRGGPVLPTTVVTNRLVSWTELPDPEAQRFAGVARYRISFLLEANTHTVTNTLWTVDLGKVCHSAKVYLNGIELGTLIMEPFKADPVVLSPGTNTLEVEVVNLSANRIRDLDRRGVQWKIFHDINFVNINYRPFDASEWPLVESGLLGPVRLVRVEEFWPGR